MSQPSHSPALLRCERLVVGYGGQPLLPPIDLEVGPGELLLVVGRNGAGKSTWLKTVLGLLAPVSGRVSLRQPPPRLVYVPQAAEVDDLLPVRGRDLVDWGRLRGWGFLRPMQRATDRAARQRALEGAHAAPFADRPFRDLSGGQRQRILFARILGSEAELALLDEPTAAMDMATEREAYERLAELAREHRVGIIAVTHTLSVAARHADRLLFLDAGDRGRDAVVMLGSPGEVGRSSQFQRSFGEVLDAGPAGD